MNPIHTHPDGIVIKVYVQPRSAKNVIVGRHGDALKIKLTAAPVAGEANRLCVKFLAKNIGLPKSSLEIISGHSSRTKQVLVHENSVKGKKQIHARIQRWMDTK